MKVLPKLSKLWPWVDLILFYAKVKFGHIGFCMGKISLWSRVGIKGQGHSLTLVKGHSDFKVKTCFFSKTIGSFGTKIHMKAWGRIGMKIYINELGHMTNMAAMPIYGKNLKKCSFPEPIDPWPWNIVCSIMYGSTTKVVQIMALGWPWPNIRQGQIWSDRLLYRKKWKLFNFWKLLQP